MRRAEGPARRPGRCIDVREPDLIRTHPFGTIAILAIAAGMMLTSIMGCGETRRPRNAVLIILDTLRPDRLSLYGGERPTSPVLDRLGERGVVFEQAVTNATWTLPALSGLLSGRYLTAEVQNITLQRSMVEELQQAGWTTAAFTEGGYFRRDFGMNRGFDVFFERGRNRMLTKKERVKKIPEEEKATEITRTFSLAREWLRNHDKSVPFFLVVHTYEPHIPYLRTTFSEGMDRGGLGERFALLSAGLIHQGKLEVTDASLEYIRALYDGDILHADRYVGELLATLEELSLSGDTLIVVTSDHGEDLGDREPMAPGYHGHSVHDEVALVPLIIFDPTTTYKKRRVSAQVRTIDTMHTILDLLGIESAGDRHGRSLVPMMTGRETEDRPAFTRLQSEEGSPRRDMYALRENQKKLIVIPPRPGEAEEESVSLYDLSTDPGELDPIGDEDPATESRMLEELERLRAELDAQGSPVLKAPKATPKPIQDQLRALGYIE